MITAILVLMVVLWMTVLISGSLITLFNLHGRVAENVTLLTFWIIIFASLLLVL